MVISTIEAAKDCLSLMGVGRIQKLLRRCGPVAAVFMAKPSVAYLKAVEALNALLEAEGVGSVERAFAEASHTGRQQLFQQRHGVKQSQGQPWAGRLLGKLHSSRSELENPRGTDHPSLWLRDGKAHMFMYEPYYVGHDGLRALVDYCERWGFEASITAEESFWFPGRTLAVVLRRKAETGEGCL